jgi:hypothetical protein
MTTALHFWSYRRAGCITGHYLAVAELRERVPVNKQAKKRFDMRDI